MNWLDWSLLENHADVHRFLKLLIARRLLRDTGPERKRTTLTQFIRDGIRGWHGVRLNEPDWSDHSHSVALSVELAKEGLRAYFIFNSYWEPLDFELPRIGAEKRAPWRRWIDTFREAPDDIAEWQAAPAFLECTYHVGPRSVVVLLGECG
jgi:glycogen operon protein